MSINQTLSLSKSIQPEVTTAIKYTECPLLNATLLVLASHWPVAYPTRSTAIKHSASFVVSWYPRGPVSQSAQDKYFNPVATVFENPIFSKAIMFDNCQYCCIASASALVSSATDVSLSAMSS